MAQMATPPPHRSSASNGFRHRSCSRVFSYSIIGTLSYGEDDNIQLSALNASNSFGLQYRRTNPSLRGFIKQRPPTLVGWSTLIHLEVMHQTMHFSTSSAASDKIITEDETLLYQNSKLPVMSFDSCAEGLDLTSFFVWALHDSARFFLHGLEQQEALTRGPWFAKAWIGVDMNAWLKYLSYQAAICALLQTIIKIGAQEEDKRTHSHAEVQKILSQQINRLEVSVRNQLCSKDPNADKWFWSEQFPAAVSRFMKMMNSNDWFNYCRKRNLKQNDLALGKASAISLTILATCCCKAAIKLGPGKISHPEFLLSLAKGIENLISLLADLNLVEEMYIITSQVGLRDECLKHLGLKLGNRSESKPGLSKEKALWVHFIHNLLESAFLREGVILKLECAGNTKIAEGNLAVFGFFAVLGRKTRSFLSSNNIISLDERLGDFFSYLEGGSVLFYPELSSLMLYQLFIEVSNSELEWLPFYSAADKSISENKRLPMQSLSTVEKDRFLSVAFSVCSDWLTSFIYYSEWIQQPGGKDAAKFLLNSQNQLNVLLEEYWPQTENDKLSKGAKHREVKISYKFDAVDDQHNNRMVAACGINDSGIKSLGLSTKEVNEAYLTEFSKTSEDPTDLFGPVKPRIEENLEPVQHDVFRRSLEKIKTMSSDLWMGTQLLATDVTLAMDLSQKRFAGHTLTERERNKLKQTLTDIASVIPIGILMLLPVSAVGHAAMLAAIQKYAPGLIPSAFSASRLDLIKQLNRVKEINVSSTSTAECLTYNGTIMEANKN